VETPVNGAPIPVNALPLHIGADSGGGTQFTGAIDEPRIFNRGLSNDEIAALFQQGPICSN
jgi:hypothetical protein